MYERWVNGTLDYRIQLQDGHLPQGPDGQGRNRLAIHPMAPLVRCVLRPTTRQGALDTLRGMAYHGGNPTAYEPCRGTDCRACPVACRQRMEWQPTFRIREESCGVVLEEQDRQMFASWAALLAAVDVPALTRGIDQMGTYWIAG